MEFPHHVPRPEELERMDAAELDALPFGLLELDADGVVRRANRLETGRIGSEPHEFVGRNFFDEIAPCTNVKEYAESFREGVQRGRWQRTFVFRYPSGEGTYRVVVHIMVEHIGYGWVLATLEGDPSVP